MGRFPILVRILFVPAALILLFLLAVLTGIVLYATFDPGSGTPDIVRQFRQAPITGEVSSVVLGHMLANPGTAGLLAMFTEAVFSGDGHINAILACRRANCALPSGMARQQGIWT